MEKICGFVSRLSRYIDSNVQRVLDALAVQCPCAALMGFVFSFPVQKETIIQLTASQRQMSLGLVVATQLQPLLTYVRQQPKIIQDNDVLNECCGYVINVFQTHLVEVNQRSAGHVEG